MATFTSRLGLRKPATADQITVDIDLGDNMDTIDAVAGYAPCTSSARPAVPFQGQCIYETDTGYIRFWDGASWDLITSSGAVSSFTATARTTNLDLSPTTTTSQAIMTLSNLNPGSYYAMDGFLLYNSSTAADISWQLAGATGNSFFATYGVATSVTTRSGSIDIGAVQTGLTLSNGGDGTTTASNFMPGLPVRGIIVPSGTTFSLNAAQVTAAATAGTTVIRAGTWMRLQRLS